MAIDIPDVRRRISRMRAPEISTDDIAPAMDRAGRTLRDWRKSTEAALASLGDLSLDSLPQVSLPQVSLDSLPGRRRPSPVRQNGPFIVVALLGVIAGVIIGWWMASTARMGSATAAKPGGWRERGRSSDQRAAARSESGGVGGSSDAAWSIGRQSSGEPAASSVPGAAGSSDMTDRHGEGHESESSQEAWRGMGPGRSAEPVTASELASRTARTD